MANRGLSDAEVVNELKKMVAFIKQEAMEKAREIKVKADEEFAIEKGKIVRQETNNIDGEYERKRKQAETKKMITRSNQTNKARLRLLEEREGLLEKTFEEAREQLIELSKDESKYSSLLKSLILQGLYAMMEKDIKIECRKKDEGIVKKVAEEAKKTYQEESERDIRVDVVSELSDDLAGGVIVTGYSSRLRVNNTLDERLRLLEEKMLPEIRDALFGQNPNRAHRD